MIGNDSHGHDPVAGQVVVITGGGGVIGRAICEAFGRSNALVAVASSGRPGRMGLTLWPPCCRMWPGLALGSASAPLGGGGEAAEVHPTAFPRQLTRTTRSCHAAAAATQGMGVR